jgi:hypothetical protein
VAWKPNAAIEAVCGANSPAGAITRSASMFCAAILLLRRGHSLVVRADDCSVSGIGRSGHSIRCESRRGKGKPAGAVPTQQSASELELSKKSLQNKYLQRELDRGCVLFVQHPSKNG